jgi:hypothetical protein
MSTDLQELVDQIKTINEEELDERSIGKLLQQLNSAEQAVCQTAPDSTLSWCMRKAEGLEGRIDNLLAGLDETLKALENSTAAQPETQPERWHS